MPTISECIFTISEVTYLSLQNSDFFTTLHLESMLMGFLSPVNLFLLIIWSNLFCKLSSRDLLIEYAPQAIIAY